MEWLNYHHLYYFWMVAKEGTIARACAKLHLAQPTISGQLRALERSLGEKLFNKAGRTLALTDAGRLVYRYADEIFSIGRELREVLRGQPGGRPMRLVVGISDAIPKLVAARILEPVYKAGTGVQLVCYEDRPEDLMAQLATHSLDVVLTDEPAGSPMRIRSYSHLLGSCGVKLFAAPALASRLRRGFPESLGGAPLLLPIEGSAMRRALEEWFDRQRLRPVIAGEFQDGALLKEFGRTGIGVFAAPSAIEDELQARYQVRPVGALEGVAERFYAITVERRLSHPAVAAISASARATLFDGR
jgi:LysR family transcriptional activator of nhaA